MSFQRDDIPKPPVAEQDSNWIPLTNDILSCAKSGKSIALAKNMESDQNHIIKYEQFLEDLTRGHKPDQRKSIKKLKDVYRSRLENKDVVKIKILSQRDNMPNS